MKLTAQHIALIELLADPLNMTTNAEKATEAGLSEKTLYRMLKEPEALALLHQRTTALVGTARPEAYRCLIRGFQNGDRASARDFLTAIGDIGSGTNVVTNIHQTEETLADRIDKERRFYPEDAEEPTTADRN